MLTNWGFDIYEMSNVIGMKKLNSLNKKALSIILCICCLISLVCCGAPDSVKQEAKDKVDDYKSAFEQKVQADYGKDAKLTDVECKIDRTSSSSTPELSYKTRSYLSGKLIVDGKRYNAIYDYDNDMVYDTVHTGDILDTIIESLPVDQDKFYGTKILDPDMDHPKFAAEVDSFDKALQYGSYGGAVRIFIITTEDLSGLKNYDFYTIPKIKDISESDNFDCMITIVSCKNKDRISALTGKVDDLQFFSNSHPKLITNQGESVDAFDYYGINSVVRLDFAYGENSTFYCD